MRKVLLTLKFGICDRKINEENDEFDLVFTSPKITDEQANKLVRFLMSDLHYYFIEQVKNRKV